jgi:hypothetical protein
MDLILLSTFFQQPDANGLEIGATVQEILHFLNLKQKDSFPARYVRDGWVERKTLTGSVHLL